MKLSIVVLCWNDREIISNCLRSIFDTAQFTDYEVIVCDNGSKDGSVEMIRRDYPRVQVIENGRNLRFAKANNIGIRASLGEYVLILNPDTIIHSGTLDKMVVFADGHPEGGAFGCRVLNADGSYQVSARPFASLRGEWIGALYLRGLARLHPWFTSDTYWGWNGATERDVDWLSGCFILVRGNVLRSIGGFDEQFFYYYEDMDLCRQIWAAGYRIMYTPDSTITHLGGQSTKTRLPAIGFILDSQVTRYLYYYKYSGKQGIRHARWIALISAFLRLLAFATRELMYPTARGREQLAQVQRLLEWNYRVDPVGLVEHGMEPMLRMTDSNRVTER